MSSGVTFAQYGLREVRESEESNKNVAIARFLGLVWLSSCHLKQVFRDGVQHICAGTQETEMQCRPADMLNQLARMKVLGHYFWDLASVSLKTN